MKNYFTDKELACHCCGRINFSEEFRDKLNQAREKAGIVFNINSGCRCPGHNDEVGGNPVSSHICDDYIQTTAVDIQCLNSVDRFKIVNALLDSGITRIGIAKSFVHADDDSSKIKGVIWLY